MTKKISILAIGLLLVLNIYIFGATNPKIDEKMKRPDRLEKNRYPDENIALKYLITPEPKFFYPVSDDTVGYTYYDLQNNDSQRRQIANGPDGTLHFTWTNLIGPQMSYSRYVDYNSYKTSWLNPEGIHITPAEARAGFCGLNLLPDGREVLFYHYTQPYSTFWGTTISIEDSIPGTVQLSVYDIPDFIDGYYKGEWPTVGCSKMGSTDYIHITHDGGNTTSTKDLAYLRCYEHTADSLICQSPGWDSSLVIPENTRLEPNIAPYVFAYARVGSPVIATSPVSEKVALAWLQNYASSNIRNEVYYVESTNNGDDWIAAGNMIPIKITNYEGTDIRAYNDLAVVYDYNDELHIIWTTFPEGNSNNVTLWHWSLATGIRKVSSAFASPHFTPPFVEPGAYNLLLAKFTLGVGSDPSDSAYNYLYVNYTKFKQDDISAGGYANGDICVKASSNGGLTWGAEINLTNTNSDGCLPGNCESEHWSSIAEKVDSFLYIQYIYDLDAGGIPYDEGTFTLNPVRYLKYPRFLVPPLAALNFTPTQMIDPVRWAKNNQTASDSLIVNNEWGTTALYVQIGGPSWVNISPADFSIAEGGLPQKVNLTFSGGGFADTFLVDSLRILSNNDTSGEIYSDTDWVKIHFVVTDTFYYAEYDTIDNGTIITKVSNTGNLGNQEGSSGMLYKGNDYLYDFSPVMCVNIPGYGNKSASWIHNRQDFLPESHLQVTDCPGLRSIIVKSSFAPINPTLSPPYHWFWWWYALEERSIFFEKPVNPPANPVHYERAILKYTRLYKNPPPPWWCYTASEPPVSPEAYLGILADWDIPRNYSGYHIYNTGGFDSSSHLIWVRGRTGYYDNLYGAILFLYSTKDEDTSWAPFSARVLDNTTQIYPSGGPEDDSLYKYMSTPSWSTESDSAQDKSILLSGIHLQDIDTSTLITLKYALLITDQGKADLDTLAGQFRRAICGDANLDGKVTISDVVHLINYLFKGGVEPWLYYSDCNGDSMVSVSDIVYEINYLFKSGPTLKCDCGKL